MENNETDKGKRESDEQIKKELDQRLHDLKRKLKEQKEALEKFLARMKALPRNDPDEKEDDP